METNNIVVGTHVSWKLSITGIDPEYFQGGEVVNIVSDKRKDTIFAFKPSDIEWRENSDQQSKWVGSAPVDTSPRGAPHQNMSFRVKFPAFGNKFSDYSKLPFPEFTYNELSLATQDQIDRAEQLTSDYPYGHETSVSDGIERIQSDTSCHDKNIPGCQCIGGALDVFYGLLAYKINNKVINRQYVNDKMIWDNNKAAFDYKLRHQVKYMTSCKLSLWAPRPQSNVNIASRCNEDCAAEWQPQVWKVDNNPRAQKASLCEKPGRGRDGGSGHLEWGDHGGFGWEYRDKYAKWRNCRCVRHENQVQEELNSWLVNNPEPQVISQTINIQWACCDNNINLENAHESIVSNILQQCAITQRQEYQRNNPITHPSQTPNSSNNNHSHSIDNNIDLKYFLKRVKDTIKNKNINNKLHLIKIYYDLLSGSGKAIIIASLIFVMILLMVFVVAFILLLS